MLAGCAPVKKLAAEGAVFEAPEALRSGGAFELVGPWRAKSDPFRGELVDPGVDLRHGAMERRFEAAGERIVLEAELHVPDGAPPLAIYFPRSNATTRTRCAALDDSAAAVDGAAIDEERLVASHAPYLVVLPRSARMRCTMRIDQGGSARTTSWTSAPRLQPLETGLAEAWHERAAGVGLLAFLLTFAAYFHVQARLHRSDRGAAEVTGLTLALAVWLTSFRGLVAPSGPLVAELLERIEFAAVGAAVLLGSSAIEAFRNADDRGPRLRTLRAVVLALAVACLVVPKSVLLTTLRTEQTIAFALAITAMVRLAKDAWYPARSPNAWVLLGGFGSIIVLGLTDFIFALVRGPVGLAPFGIVVLVFAIAAVHARRAAEQLRTIEHLAASLERTNQAIGRFVPREFLQALGHADVTGASLGDAIERDMTVLFADIRGFTTLAERLSPGATFELLNTCLARLGPHIRVQGGFIDKYIGDAILGLFPGSPSDALRAAVAMQRELGGATWRPTGRGPLAVGIGIHRGTLMLGTIGEAQRFEATVISDAVNVTARLESLTKQVGCSVLLSREVAESLDGDARRFVRPLGPVLVKGRSAPIALHECFEADDPELREAKLRTREPLENAWRSLAQGRPADCLAAVAELHARFPEDLPLAWLALRLSETSPHAPGPGDHGALVLPDA